MDDAENKARGVTYVDRVTRKTYQVRGRAVIPWKVHADSSRLKRGG